ARARGAPLALSLPAPWPRAALAGRGGVRAAARALAGAGAPARRARRLGVLHRLLLGHALLPPPHGRAVDELPPLLAARPDELRSDERERARAGAEDRHDALGGDAARRAAGA